MKTILSFLIAAAMILGSLSDSVGQKTSLQRKIFPYSNKFTLGGGVSQLFLGGFNLQAEYTTNRFVFDYSHGFNLNFKGSAASLIAQRQHLAEKLTSTLGLGVGCRLTPVFDIRFEPKIHFYEVGYDEKMEQRAAPFAKYKTITLGVGAYYRYYPFKNQCRGLAGILIMPSVRYWPNVWSSLENDRLTYFNRMTKRTEVYKAAPQGFPATKGLLANVTFAYTFQFKRALER